MLTAWSSVGSTTLEGYRNLRKWDLAQETTFICLYTYMYGNKLTNNKDNMHLKAMSKQNTKIMGNHSGSKQHIGEGGGGRLSVKWG